MPYSSVREKAAEFEASKWIRRSHSEEGTQKGPVGPQPEEVQIYYPKEPLDTYKKYEEFKEDCENALKEQNWEEADEDILRECVKRLQREMERKKEERGKSREKAGGRETESEGSRKRAGEGGVSSKERGR